jgi:hypothetical protein
MKFADLYPNYVQKALRKNKTQEEVDTIICWLTGHTHKTLKEVISQQISVRSFFEQSPHFNEHAHLITGVICGVKIDEIEDPLMKKIRYLDKLIDELVRGKAMDKILRT